MRNLHDGIYTMESIRGICTIESMRLNLHDGITMESARWNLCCTPFVEVYHPWIFTPSMDKRISSSVHFTRLVAGGSTNLKKNPWIAIHNPWMRLLIHRLRHPAHSYLHDYMKCATRAISCKYMIYHLTYLLT